MADRYIVFDVETPNYANNRMSAIGVVVVEDGKMVKEINTLVNPEAHFDSFNISLTGIHPEDVRDAPTFPELWKTLEPIFSSGILVAHNAAFDVRVLSHCLHDYGIRWRAKAEYACTVTMGRRVYPQLPNHKLDTLCRYKKIPLHHHEAGSDCRACAMLLIDYINHGMDPKKYKKSRVL